jgi:hypothetical protein
MGIVEKAFWYIVAFLTWGTFAVLGTVLYVGIPIAGLYIVYRIAKFLFTGEW